MEHTEQLLLEVLREISQSNQQLSKTLETSINLVNENQQNTKILLPIAIDIFETLSKKSEWTEQEIDWYTGLKSALESQKKIRNPIKNKWIYPFSIQFYPFRRVRNNPIFGSFFMFGGKSNRTQYPSQVNKVFLLQSSANNHAKPSQQFL